MFRSAAASRFVSTRRNALLVGSSALALMFAVMPSAHARQFGSSSPTVAPPTVATDAATEAAEQAAKVAKQARDSMSRATQAIQTMQGAQAAARAAAQAAQKSTTLPTAIPNGLGSGGLLPNVPAGWTGANQPTQSVDSTGQTNVNINQNASQAILNWTTFNVGARTTLTFDQHGNASWVALNRVDASTGPSQILGSIKADGTVLVINQSGIIFGGASQVNVGSLIASTAGITDAKFLASGIYSTQVGDNYVPSFTGGGDGASGGLNGRVVVEQGAQITTNAPVSVTQGGGYVLLMGTEVDNAGAITAPKGQVELAAGHDFVLRAGLSSDGNPYSTTRGNEIAPGIWTGTAGTAGTWTAGGGTVTNTGIAFAQQGDITLAGHTIIQDGVLISTTSVNQRGTIHLLNSAADSSGSVTLTGNSLALILPELDSSDTALDSQRDALIADSAQQNLARSSAKFDRFDNLSRLSDREDQSRIEIVTGGTVDFQNGSLTQAQGGQVAVSAVKRVFTESGATIDVSGVQGVLLPMSANEIQVNIQGNELRDSPDNRDSGNLASQNVWIDVRDLILVPAGAGGYATDRYYTPGGLLEVSGYLNNTGHSIGEWAALGGSITLSAAEVVAQQGSTFNISGGSLQYQGGYLQQTYVIGSDGGIYNINDAPSGVAIKAVADGFLVDHHHWGVTEIYQSPWGNKTARWEDGYTVGRDAGRLILSTPTSLFEGDILADVVTGERQRSARPSGVTDGYKYTQNTAPLPGTLALGSYNATGLAGGASSTVVFGNGPGVDTTGLSTGDALPANVANTAYFNADKINADRLGGVIVASANSITIDAPLVFAPGGKVTLLAPIVDIRADIAAPSGSVTVSNILTPDQAGASRTLLLMRDGQAMLTLESGATIDVRGLWTNELLDPNNASGEAFADGGNVTFDSTQGVTLAAGSKIDVSSGAVLLPTGRLQGGKGGSVTLIADDPSVTGTVGTAAFTLDGDINAIGVNGGGTFTIKFGQSVLIGDAGVAAPGQLVLPADYFDKGFSNYDISAGGGVTVADGAQIEVIEPVYEFTGDGFGAPTGSDPSSTLKVWLPPLFTEDTTHAKLTQRGGASLALRTVAVGGVPVVGGNLTVGRGASIMVDPGQSITLDSVNQTVIDGALTAHGGTIKIINEATNNFDANGHQLGHVLWLDGDAVLDVSGQAYTALDFAGRAYGVAGSGGSIQVNAGSSFLVLRPGAVLDADGASAAIDGNAGATPNAGRNPITLAGNGGSISLSSSASIYNDATMQAHAGGAGAAGGTFTFALSTAGYLSTAGSPPANFPQVPSVIAVAQGDQGSGLPDGTTPATVGSVLPNGHGVVSADALARAGFDNLSISGGDIIRFDGNVALKAGQSITFSGGAFAETAATGHVTIDAPYVFLAGHQGVKDDITLLGIWSGSTSATQAQFDVNADLIDFRYDNYFGAKGVIGGVNYDFLGFQDVNFTSQGDARFLVSPGNTDNPSSSTRIYTPGNLTFTVAQLYPVTGAMAVVWAGAAGIGSTPDTSTSSITIKRVSDVDPGVPMSVFGTLQLMAPVIHQGGIVRAPLGVLQIGGDGEAGTVFLKTQVVDFLPGSITSVSADGLTVPYGGTTDGLSYLYAGANVSAPRFAVDTFGNLSQGISISSAAVDVRAGATLDVSGGGNLTGHAFISGRGGSVDVLKTPLVNANPTNSFSSAGDKVYAIVPGYGSSYAPSAVENGAGDPIVGQQITVPAGVPGLPAGTYTLLPSNYALLPGAYRVEVGANISPALASIAGAAGNGSYVIAGYKGVANTSIKDALPTQLIVTAADAVRKDSQYDEQSYSDFLLANAATFGQVRPVLPIDAKTLVIQFGPRTFDTTTPAFNFDGQALFQAAPGGFGGTVMLSAASIGLNPDLEIYAPGAGPTTGFNGVSLGAADLDALVAPRLVIGGFEALLNTTIGVDSHTNNVFVRAGVTLTAGEVVLSAQGDISVEHGVTISTIGQGPVPFDLSNGFTYGASGTTLLLSNGDISFINSTGSGAINIAAGASLYSEGSLAFATNGATTIDPASHYGTRILELAASSINIGDGTALGATVPTGINFDQALFDRLVAGAGAGAPAGVPGLEQLVLGAGKSINFYGTTGFDASGTGAQLVLTTPAIYGYGTAADHASLKAGTLVWSGVSGATLPAIGANGPGSGTGTLDISAGTIILGYTDSAVPNNQVSLDRATYGFATVNMTASTQIISNNKGSLSVYLAPSTDPHAVLGTSGTGGDLNIATPLLTGTAGSIMAYAAGGSLVVAAPAGAAPPQSAGALGAEIDLSGGSVALASMVLLPSGKLVVTANTGNITIGAGANLDLSGQPTTIQDQTVYGFGGDVILTSAHGSIIQAAGSTIDVSAINNNAGTITATATDAAAGEVALNGTLRGGSTMSPGVIGAFDGGFITISAQTLQSGNAASLSSDFAALNAALNAAGFSGSRAFDFKQGNLTVGDDVKAQQVAVSVDGGSLTVNGRIDASGATPGSIRLAARDDLTLVSSAVLDAHGTQLQTDSYGQPIDARNKATIELNATHGTLTLGSGSTMDESSPDGIARGEINLNAARGTIGSAQAPGDETSGDIKIEASGPLTIRGAKSIAVNGFWTYTDAPADPSDPNGQLITQGYLDGIDARSRTFVDAAMLNGDLQHRLAGLKAYGDAYHLRPGVEIDSATPNGNLTVSGDLNLANYRYGPGATGHGAGEPGVLILRAGGNLNINGSITDGFDTPPNTPDDFGWQVMTGGAIGPSGLTLTQGVTLGTGTTFRTGSGSTLSFALPIQGGSWPAGTPTPKAVTLAVDYTLPAGTVLTVALRGPGTLAPGSTLAHDSGQLTQDVVLQADWTIDPNSAYGQYVDNVLGGIDVKDPDGNFLPPVFSGTLIPRGYVLPANDQYTVFTAGFTIPANVFPSGLPVTVTNPAGSRLSAPLTLAAGTNVPVGMVFPTKAFITGGTQTAANVPLPTQVTLADNYTLAAPLMLTGTITTPTQTFAAGTTLDPGTVLPVGTVVGAGTSLPFAASIDSMNWPANTPLTFAGSTVSPGQNLTLPAGTFIAGDSNLLSANGTTQLTRQGQIWAAAPMLPAGSLSWSMRLVAGADLSSADTRVLQAMSALSGAGNLTLNDPHVAASTGNPLVFSVLRTGTGDLDLLAGGNFSEKSPFGVYTAGTQSADVGPNGVDTFNRSRGTRNGLLFQPDGDPGYETAVDGTYQAWYPENGGDVLLSAQGNVTGYTIQRDSNKAIWIDGTFVPNWLWRQADPDGTNAAWWINFGTYILGNQYDAAPVLTGFRGIGTLGGGNLTVIAGGNAGTLIGGNSENGGLDLAVASTGRVLPDGTVVQTGGGDLTLRVGGRLNPVPLSTSADVDMNGTLTDLRGNIDIKAGSIGLITPLSPGGNNVDPTDPRPLDYRQFEMSTNSGGIIVVPGDGTVNIGTRGDLVIAGAGDAGMLAPIDTVNGVPYSAGGAMSAGGGDGRFTLWTATTAIGLYSAGGNISPGPWSGQNGNGGANVGANLYPATLDVEAASGSIYFYFDRNNGRANPFIELMPAANGQLSLLAGDSIYGESVTIMMSGADSATLATPAHAVFQQLNTGSGSNSTPGSAYRAPGPLGQSNPIAFGPDTPTTNLHADDTQPSLVYAGNDIVDLGIGLVKTLSADPFGNFNPQPTTWYYAAEPFRIIAGRDIVGAGIPKGSLSPVLTDVILNNNPNDISVIWAGRDILYGAATIAGPGLLDVEAGRNFYAGSVGMLHSVGPLVNVDPSNRSSGAGIVLMAGVGTDGPDYADFAKLYFNPANQLPSDGTPLDGSGKVVHTYDQELLAWLQQRFGYAGSSADALTYFLALPVEQQGVFVRQVYYTELTAGGREYNNLLSPRYGSYLRGREAIATLFPTHDASGQPITYQGDITMFSGQAFYTGHGDLDTVFHSGDSTRTFDAGIHTDFGGDIQVLNPGGQTIAGVEGFAPGASAGLITQGSGDIDIYSLGSILLGQSRIMTTFGGDILAWSAEGDINAGRGSKTTTIFTPPRRTYDSYGNLTLSPTVPSAGAGIATLNPIPEVPRGDIDLIAPLGTIDAGEAGIRVSGNVNLAALQVVNAANIQVQGTATGLPTVQGPPVAALTSASNTAAATQQSVAPTQNSAGQTSVMIVEIVGYGGGDAEPSENEQERRGKRPGQQSYDPTSSIQYVGAGQLTDDQMRKLTDDERRNLAER